MSSVLREDSERRLMTEAKAATAGEAFSIMLPMPKQLIEFVTTPHEKWGDRPQQMWMQREGTGFKKRDVLVSIASTFRSMLYPRAGSMEIPPFRESSRDLAS